MRRSEVPESLADPSTWPGVDISALAPERQEIYQRRELAVRAYLRGEPVADVEHSEPRRSALPAHPMTVHSGASSCGF